MGALIMNEARSRNLPESVDVAVVGAGIGGLCAALALSQRGFEVLLLERAPRFEALGAGIVLAANASAALGALGVDVASFGRALGGMDILRADGAVLSRLPLERLRSDVGPVLSCHRAELHRALEVALPVGVRTSLGVKVLALAQTSDSVTLTVLEASGASREVRAKLVVGADGLRSVVRAQLGEDAPLRYSGETCWRAIVRGVAVQGATESWGVRSRVGVVPLADEQGKPRVYTFWTTHAPHGAVSGSFAEVVARFAAFQGDARRAIDATREADLLHHDLWETSAPTWGHGRTWLLGDAAHGMTPNQGQGAAMAIEDALALALALANAKGLATSAVADAHAEYVAVRHERVRSVQLDSRRLGDLAGWAAWPLVPLRDLLLRLVPESASLSHYRKLAAPGLVLAARARDAV
jgi:2-polyprenyl-6-methoxyphenol hydroxylase-like FAD-dependent oxidoreductase